jgi:hypothetical protein
MLNGLHKAAGVAEANSQHALEMAQKFSHQLRAAEDRIAELEAEIGIYQEKAGRAEQWLHRGYTEIGPIFTARRRPSWITPAQAGSPRFALSGPKMWNT